MAIVRDLARPESIVDIPMGQSNTSRNRFAITPSDTVNFTKFPREILVGGAGTVAIVDFDNVVTTVTAVAGQSISAICKRINSTGTSATGLVGII